MEHLPWNAVCFAAVERVAYYGMSQMREVDADLVRAACAQADFLKGELFADSERLVFRYGFLAACFQNGAAAPTDRAWTDWQIDGPIWRLHFAADNR